MNFEYENVCLSFRIIGLFNIGCTRFSYATFPWVVKRLHIALTFAPIIWTSLRCSFTSDNNSNRRSHSFVEIFKPRQSLNVEIEKLKDGPPKLIFVRDTNIKEIRHLLASKIKFEVIPSTLVISATIRLLVLNAFPKQDTTHQGRTSMRLSVINLRDNPKSIPKIERQAKRENNIETSLCKAIKALELLVFLNFKTIKRHTESTVISYNCYQLLLYQYLSNTDQTCTKRPIFNKNNKDKKPSNYTISSLEYIPLIPVKSAKKQHRTDRHTSMCQGIMLIIQSTNVESIRDSNIYLNNYQNPSRSNQLYRSSSGGPGDPFIVYLQRLKIIWQDDLIDHSITKYDFYNKYDFKDNYPVIPKSKTVIET
ncbi:hypothetical protein BD560DRAFT_494635 [Blakeslea trispora]|nr:hypothetical protein BD560DRAFT_494635 [Blakeslea trispora]